MRSNIESFRRQLQAAIRWLQQHEPLDVDLSGDAAEFLGQCRKQALSMGLAEVADILRCPADQLGLNAAQGYLSAAIATLPSNREPATDGMMSLKDAAEYLGYPGDDALRQIVDRSKAKARGVATKGATIKFFQPSKGSPIRFKREWLDDFIAEHAVEPADRQHVPNRKREAAQTPVNWSHGLDPSLFGSGTKAGTKSSEKNRKRP